MVELRALYKAAGSERLYDVINRGYLAIHARRLKPNLTRRAGAVGLRLVA